MSMHRLLKINVMYVLCLTLIVDPPALRCSWVFIRSLVKLLVLPEQCMISEVVALHLALLIIIDPNAC